MVYWSKALYVFLYCAIFLAKKAESLPECKEGEFHYEYTECGADGGRWHVPVPHYESKCAVTMRPPLYQKSCDGTCPAGQFTDVSLLSEECKPCPKGKHSLGSAVRYTNWTEFPPDFDTYATLDFGESWRNEGESQCNASWVADGNLLRTEVSPCLLRLTYIANVVKDEGSITFWYYYTNDYNGMFFSVSVRNEQCEITKQRRDGKKDNGEEKDEEMSDEDMSDDVYYNTDDDDVISLDPSSQYVWKNATLKLKRGKNLVVWQVERWSNEGNSFSKMAFIREIEVKGTASTSECVNCPPGTFADKVGSGKCEQCEANFFSEAGAKECEPCNEKTEYAPRGSAKCLERPACEKKDYMEISSECDEENKFQTLYKWIEPKICSEFLDGAVKLHEAGPKVECPTCSPGMYLKDNKCLFCSVGYFSDGVKGCAKCLPTTASDLKHDYRTWRNWPPATDHWCSSYVDGCSTPAGWQLRGHYIDSGFGHSDDVSLDLEVKTAGFAGDRGLVSRIATEVGSVTIDFEMDCEGSCEFTMFERKFNRNSATVAHWNGRNTRQNFTYAVTEKGPLTFRWGFKKEGKRVFDPDLKTYKYINDRVKIYSVLLSNTVDGGAEVCSKCRFQVEDSSCVECPTGQYFDAQSSMCKPCKSGTFLNNNKCEKCGPGLVSNPSSSKCYSSCHYHGKDGRHINFLQLKGIHVARTNKFFFGKEIRFSTSIVSICVVWMLPKRPVMTIPPSKMVKRKCIN
ncbi:endosome/lysosome-associated apoptosis and autophagy regulator family member 2-like [Xenia sp. Carnegie-2017]|uniref:endosome/lysosome-associated apoptosis and autophagy regulator family member 2-like n=1 Tax=Xenia sp. Carnegie-2017 TaxID=2897299 RepID=UPI001F034136|nr:endosome/lysosome-associated apoptosis and autophagy regulator family member 2-like [Xenia sp. Carnegie-2017]